jgi:hypothetical protein
MYQMYFQNTRKTGITLGLANLKYLIHFMAPRLSSETLAAFGSYHLNNTWIGLSTHFDKLTFMYPNQLH